MTGPRVLLLVNSRAGRHDAAALDALCGRLAAAGATVERCDPVSATALEAEAAATFADVVLVAGGDGTLARACAGLLARPAPRPRLAVVPQGTADVLAHEYALPRDPAAVAAAVLAGRTRPLHFGLARDLFAPPRPFFLAVSAGFDAEVVHAVEASGPHRFKKLAFVLAALRFLSRPRPELSLNLTAPDGVRSRLTAELAIVAKARHYAGTHVLTRAAAMSAPGLRLIALRRAGPLALVAAALRLAVGRLEQSSNVVSLPIAAVRISSRDRLAEAPTQIDGDPLGITPLEIETLDATLDLIVA